MLPIGIGGNTLSGYYLQSSLRFRRSASGYLERTPSSSGTSSTQATWSMWVKLAQVQNNELGVLFEQGNTSNDRIFINVRGNGSTYPGSIQFGYGISASYRQIITNDNATLDGPKFVDPSAWYHLVCVLDTPNATQNDRMRIYVNGERQTITYSTLNLCVQSESTVVSSTNVMRIGSNSYSLSNNFDGYLTEYNFVDGQALTPSDFGETDTITGVWKPKEYTGTYGTNGYYLPFTGEITPSVTAGFGGTAENVLYDDTAYLVSNTSTGSSFDLVEYDFGESINMIDYNIQDFRFTGGTSTFKIYTSDVGGSLSNYTERASLSVSSSYQNYSGNLGVTARYIKIRATAFGTNGQGQINYFNVDVDSSIFSDNSGNANNWTPNNINVVADMMNDVPTLTDEDTANFCTWNPLNVATNITTTNANLSFNATTTSGNHRMVRATHGMTSGKYYWEVNVNDSSNVDIVGVSSMDFNGNPFNTYVGGHSASAGYGYNTSNGNWYGNGFTINGATPPAFPSSGIIGVAFDADNGELYFHRNGTWINSANPSAGTGSNFTASTTQSGYLPAISTYNNQGTWSANFGQFPFAYTPPTGYKKLNTYNLPDSTIADGSEYMNTITWTGDNTSPRSLTGVGFSPDLTWIKRRDSAKDHALFDSVRGSTKKLESNTTGAEITGDNGKIDSFDSDGFTISTGTTDNSGVNSTSNTFVGWSWRGSDSSAVSNTDGTITSTVSANTDSGFSVVTYTATGNGNDTVGHGLGIAPKVVLLKSRSTTGDWIYYTTQIDGSLDYLYLNQTASKADSGWTAPSSTVFPPSNTANGTTMVAYCFAEVEGFSKFGSYTGNGSANGPFVYTGFRPAFVMVKRSDTIGNWTIRDTSRRSYNTNVLGLFPNASYAEDSTAGRNVDMLSNGFKIRGTDSDLNTSGGTYIYMAFAENPFKQSLAR